MNSGTDRPRRGSRLAVALAGVALLALAGELTAQARPQSSEALTRRHPAAWDGFRAEQLTMAGSRTVTFDFRSTPLEEALAVIAARAGLRLAYGDGLLPPDLLITVRGEAVAPEHAFALVLLETPLEVVVLPSGYAAVVRRESWRRLGLAPGGRAGRSGAAVSPPAPAAAGVVLGPDGEPLAGAYVRLCGTRQVQLTDSAGRFAFRGAFPRGARISAAVLGLPERVVRLRPPTPAAAPAVLRLDAGGEAAGPRACPDR